LNVSGTAIARYADDQQLRFVDDESNRDGRFARSALRANVMPELARIEPSSAKALARAAAHQAEAATLLDELAAQDAGPEAGLPTLSRARLLHLSPHRARNLLRWFLRQRGLRAPPPSRLREMLRQIAVERPDAHVEIRHDDVALGMHDGHLVIHAQAPPPFASTWRGETELTLPHGIVRFDETVGTGIAASAMRGQPVNIRSRQGGEKLQVASDRPRRTLKALLREARMPVWERQGLPLLFCGDSLICVPGIGVASHCRAGPTETGLAVTWRPFVADLP
jgi:tRNA(Ile)-lysidine synthase